MQMRASYAKKAVAVGALFLTSAGMLCTHISDSLSSGEETGSARSCSVSSGLVDRCCTMSCYQIGKPSLWTYTCNSWNMFQALKQKVLVLYNHKVVLFLYDDARLHVEQMALDTIGEHG